MLRRATTGLLDRQCCPHHPLSRLGNYRSLSLSSSTIPRVEDDTFAEGEKKNSTTRALSDASDTARASDNHATPIIRRGRTRSLRPILLPPSFPLSRLLLPPESIPETSSLGDQNAGTEPSSSSSTTTTVTLKNLPLNTAKADIRSVFQRFGEITRIFIQPDGSHADVVFGDVDGFKRTLHAYAEEPCYVRGREITLFRKYMKMYDDKVSGMDDDMDAPSGVTRATWGRHDGGIFVSSFPPKLTQEELLEALEPFGKHEQFEMCPRSRHAYFIYSNKDRVMDILSVHRRVPITVRGQTLRIERAERRPYTLSTGPLGDTLEAEKPDDLVTSGTMLEELTRTVARFRGSHDPSRVLWIGRLPMHIPRAALANFWSRLGCVVDVRPSSTGGFAYVEFASTEEAMGAVYQGAPHGFRYERRQLEIDFAHSASFVGPVYRGVYITGWPASDGGSELLRWADDVPNIVEAAVLPQFRGEMRSDPRSAFLRFRTVDDARVAHRTLDGRMGPDGKTLRVRLSRLPVVHPNLLWRWVYEVERSGGDEGGEACLEDKWGGLGFGTGEEDYYEDEHYDT